MRFYISLIMVIVLSFPSYSQSGIKVIESDGVRVQQYARTTLVFKTTEPSIPLYKIINTTQSDSDYSQTVNKICDIPCKIEVEGGSYLFRGGYDLSFDPTFRVEATGGTQVWEITTGSRNLFELGFYSVIFGLSAIFTGIYLKVENTTGAGEPAIWGIAGGGLTVLGGICIGSSYGSARRIYEDEYTGNNYSYTGEPGFSGKKSKENFTGMNLNLYSSVKF